MREDLKISPHKKNKKKDDGIIYGFGIYKNK